MVPTIQTRVVQQSFRNSRVSARGTRPGTSTLLGGACSTPTAHWFLLVGGGCRCVMTSITRIGMRISLPRNRVNRGKKSEGRGLSQAPALRRLPQLQGGDLVRLEHRVPGVAVGCDRYAKWLAALDDLALGYDTIVRDPGDVALGGLGEPDRAVWRRRDTLRADVS